MSALRPRCVGIPKEIKRGEHRVAGLPEHARRLRALGCAVVVQNDAGTASGYADDTASSK